MLFFLVKGDRSAVLIFCTTSDTDWMEMLRQLAAAENDSSLIWAGVPRTVPWSEYVLFKKSTDGVMASKYCCSAYAKFCSTLIILS